MLSKSKQKLITSLSRKKVRDQEKLFIAEGHKLVSDLLNTNLKCQLLIATQEWLSNNKTKNNSIEIIEVTEVELKKCSNLKSSPPVIAIFQQLKTSLDYQRLPNQLSLFLDEVQDPGNLGTIIRMADWFGIENVICSNDCADVYNSKTVQSTMGALSRVKVHYIDSDIFFNQIKESDLKIYGTFLGGDNIYNSDMDTNGIIVMGNEGKGISDKVAMHINSRLYIPNYPQNTETSESLNVAVATAIICAEFRRRIQ